MPTGSTSRSLPKYAIVGKCAEPNCVVKHVALLANNQEFVSNSDVEVIHQAPPLAFETNPDVIKPNIYGFLELTDKQIHDVYEYLNSVQFITSSSKRQRSVDFYTVNPPFEQGPYEDSMGEIWRFSCAGLVWKAYSEAGIILCDLDELPFVELGFLDQVYDASRMRRLDRTGRQFGLQGSGPWQVLLPGYLIHAIEHLENPFGDGPFQPGLEHASYCAFVSCQSCPRSVKNEIEL